jgi:hypothetical protein
MMSLGFIILMALGLLSRPAVAQGITPSGGVGANITASSFGTTGTLSAAFSAAPGEVNYICGFVISSGGTTTAAVVQPTITGVVGGTMYFTYTFVSSGQGILGVAFPQCVGATNPNTAITLTVPAGGAGTTASVTMWGWQISQ